MVVSSRLPYFLDLSKGINKNIQIFNVPKEIQTEEKLLKFSWHSVTFAAGGIGEVSAAASLLHSFSGTVGRSVGSCGSTCGWTQVPLIRTGALGVWDLLASWAFHGISRDSWNLKSILGPKMGEIWRNLGDSMTAMTMSQDGYQESCVSAAVANVWPFRSEPSME